MAKLLVVDDDESIRRTLQRILSFAGHEVHTAENGAQAIELLEEAAEAGEPFDVLTSDWYMDVMGGEELLLEIRASADDRINSIPVIVITGEGSSDVRNRAIECGAADVILKPLDNAELVDIIRDLLQDQDGV
jgi:CheY-like chemotaxis protein